MRLTRTLLPAIASLYLALAVAPLGYAHQAKTNHPATSHGMQRAIVAIRGAYAAFNRGDLDAAVASLDPNIEWTEPAKFPGGGTYHGRDAVRGYLRQSRAGWTQGTSKPVRFIAAGNRMVVFVFVRFQPKGGKDWHEANIADVYTVRHGKIVQMNAFADRGEALRWSGAKSP